MDWHSVAQSTSSPDMYIRTKDRICSLGREGEGGGVISFSFLSEKPGEGFTSRSKPPVMGVS